MQDALDTPLGGVRVYLLSGENTARLNFPLSELRSMPSTRTDAQGIYHFTDLTPGIYRVVFEAPEGYYSVYGYQSDEATDANCDKVAVYTFTDGSECLFVYSEPRTLLPGQADDTVDMGFQLKSLGGPHPTPDVAYGPSTPTPDPTATPEATATPRVTPDPTATRQPTASPVPTPTPEPTPEPLPTPTPPRPPITPAPLPTPTPEPTPEPSPTPTLPGPPITPAPTASPSPAPSAQPTQTPRATDYGIPRTGGTPAPLAASAGIGLGLLALAARLLCRRRRA